MVNFSVHMKSSRTLSYLYLITGDHCDEVMTGCELGRCGPRRNCTDDSTALDGYICGPCQPGYSLQAGRCADVNECVANVSDCVQPQQQCINTDGGYECRCAPGYLQSRSDGTCVGMLHGVLLFFSPISPKLSMSKTHLQRHITPILSQITYN